MNITRARNAAASGPSESGSNFEKNRSALTGLALVHVVPVHMRKRSVRILAGHRVFLLHVRGDIQLFGRPQRLVDT